MLRLDLHRHISNRAGGSYEVGVEVYRSAGHLARVGLRASAAS